MLVLVFWMGTLSLGAIELVNFGRPSDLLAQMPPEKPYIEDIQRFTWAQDLHNEPSHRHTKTPRAGTFN
jgi:hypothetical protein|tara:strand:+ start:429 stop:635 length:207 start_codon:yes stop_codon:yes gene_type:complete